MDFLAIVRSLNSQQDLTHIFDKLKKINDVEVKYHGINSAELDQSWFLQRSLNFVGPCICLGLMWLGYTRQEFLWPILGCCGLAYLLFKTTAQNFLGFRRCKTLHLFHHSVLQGRMNLTNVYDSLYDNILKTTSYKEGKKSIIFVVDDVQDGEIAQHNIKVEQPTLSQCCEKIFVFQGIEKNGWNQQNDRRLNTFLQTYFNSGELAKVD